MSSKAFSFRDETYTITELESTQIKIPTFEGYEKVRHTRNVLNTSLMVALVEKKNGAHAFFVKPMLQTKTIDILGQRGPKLIF